MNQDQIYKIKEVSDIVSLIGSVVVLKKRGDNYFGLCPFHNEKTPSFSVSASKQFYHCFGCGCSGDIIEFVKQYRQTTFVDAVNRIKRFNCRTATA